MAVNADDIGVLIGERVRAGRGRIGMTRRQLAAAAGVSERYLNELENGEANATVAILVKVAGAIDSDLVSLLAPPAASGRIGGSTIAVAALERLLGGMTRAEQEGAVPLLSDYITRRRRSLKGIALLGLRGAGKTTLGRLLAERHGLPFVSVTTEVERRGGMSLTDLFNLGGADAYRALENEVVAEIAARPARVVLETAGGIVGNSEALEVILATFRTVWLKASPEEHLSRVAGQGDTRPMRGTPRALEHLRTLLAAREAEYGRAECTLDTSGRPVEDCLAELESLAGPLLAEESHAA